MENIVLELEPEMIDQEIERFYLDENGELCKEIQVIQVPTGRLIPKHNPEIAQEQPTDLP